RRRDAAAWRKSSGRLRPVDPSRSHRDPRPTGRWQLRGTLSTLGRGDAGDLGSGGGGDVRVARGGLARVSVSEGGGKLHPRSESLTVDGLHLAPGGFTNRGRDAARRLIRHGQMIRDVLAEEAAERAAEMNRMLA